MSRIHLAPRSSKKWVVALSAITIASIALFGWARTHQAALAAARYAVTDAPRGSQQGSGTATPSSPASQAEFAALAEQQSAAAAEVAQHPDLKPIVGPVTERPSYVSRLEWLMLQGVAHQHPDADAQLTHMVNFLRFNKQLELWQDMPRNSTTTARRQPLAMALLEDLPTRVRAGDVDLRTAQQLQSSFLSDAIPDEAQRQQRATLEAQRLQEAAEAEQASRPPPPQSH